MVHAVHGVFYNLTDCFATLSITFRGYEAGLFMHIEQLLVPVVYVLANVF